jgi:hypothetical protein
MMTAVRIREWTLLDLIQCLFGGVFLPAENSAGC